MNAVEKLAEVEYEDATALLGPLAPLWASEYCCVFGLGRLFWFWFACTYIELALELDNGCGMSGENGDRVDCSADEGVLKGNESDREGTTTGVGGAFELPLGGGRACSSERKCGSG